MNAVNTLSVFATVPFSPMEDTGPTKNGALRTAVRGRCFVQVDYAAFATVSPTASRGADAINQLGAPRAPADLELHASAAVHRRGALYAWTLASGAWSHIVLERLADVAVIEIEGHRQTLGTQASRAPSARGIGIIEMMSICRLSFILCGLSSQAKALKIALPLGVPSPVQAFQPGPAW